MRLFILFFLLFTALGCADQEAKKSAKASKYDMEKEPDTLYNLVEAYKWLERKDTLTSVVIDTFCINEQKRAKADIADGVLCLYGSMAYFEAPQFNELLERYGVQFHLFWSGCLPPPPGFDLDCYANEMNREVARRYSEEFIDSLVLVAEKNFVLKYPDSVYIKDGLDVRFKYLPQ